MKKIAIYGGTFDPIHHGHLILAREALEQLEADELIFVPAAVSPHKLDKSRTEPSVRLEMVAAAIESEPRFRVDDCEIRRPPPSFTIDTVEQIGARSPSSK